MFKEDVSGLWQYVDEAPFASIKQRSEKVVESEGEPIRGITFLSDNDPVSYFEQHDTDNFTTEIKRRNEFSEIKIERRIKRKQYEDGYRSLQGRFILYQNSISNVWTALSVSGREFHNKVVRRYLEKFTPAISIAYLSTDELRSLFESLDEKVDGEIWIEKAIVYSHKKESEISFEKRKFYDAFNQAENQDKYVDKLKFTVRDSENQFQGYLTRHGESRYIGGPYSTYYEDVVNGLANLISEKGDLFSDRSREYGSKDSKPLEIRFKKSAIEDTEDNISLIEALDNVKRSSLTVYHKNPYLHASVMDYTDGSSADVFITSEKSISVVPSFNASKASLLRIFDKIAEEFQEGEVKERQKHSREFEDYFR